MTDGLDMRTKLSPTLALSGIGRALMENLRLLGRTDTIKSDGRVDSRDDAISAFEADGGGHSRVAMK